jgi:hypothetical protein
MSQTRKSLLRYGLNRVRNVAKFGFKKLRNVSRYGIKKAKNLSRRVRGLFGMKRG